MIQNLSAISHVCTSPCSIYQTDVVRVLGRAADNFMCMLRLRFYYRRDSLSRRCLAARNGSDLYTSRIQQGMDGDEADTSPWDKDRNFCRALPAVSALKSYESSSFRCYSVCAFAVYTFFCSHTGCLGRVEAFQREAKTLWEAFEAELRQAPRDQQLVCVFFNIRCYSLQGNLPLLPEYYLFGTPCS